MCHSRPPVCTLPPGRPVHSKCGSVSPAVTVSAELHKHRAVQQSCRAFTAPGMLPRSLHFLYTPQGQPAKGQPAKTSLKGWKQVEIGRVVQHVLLNKIPCVIDLSALRGTWQPLGPVDSELEMGPARGAKKWWACFESPVMYASLC